MIVKIKTFSGETLYIPEEDYLNEVMYSENPNETRPSGAAGGLIGAGLGLAGGTAAGIGLATQSKKYKQAKSLINKAVEGTNATVNKNNWWMTHVSGVKPENLNRLKKIAKAKHGIARKGALAGGALGAAALGTAGYLYSRNKNKTN